MYKYRFSCYIKDHAKNLVFHVNSIPRVIFLLFFIHLAIILPKCVIHVIKHIYYYYYYLWYNNLNNLFASLFQEDTRTIFHIKIRPENVVIVDVIIQNSKQSGFVSMHNRSTEIRDSYLARPRWPSFRNTLYRNVSPNYRLHTHTHRVRLHRSTFHKWFSPCRISSPFLFLS